MKLQTRIKLPLALSIGSLFFIILIASLTNPLKNIIFVIFLYAAIFIFIASLYLLIMSFQRSDSRSGLKGALILSSVLTVMLMLRSAKALNITDLALLIFFIFGLIFYFRRRA